MTTKQDFKYFVWDSWAQVFFREIRFMGLPDDVNLVPFLPLTEESILTVCMLHPSINRENLQKAVEDWDIFQIDGKQQRFAWLPEDSRWV